MIAERLSRAGIRVSIVTNGLQVDDATVEQMVAAGVSGVSVSLDGLEPVHNRIRVASTRPKRASSSFESAVRALGCVVASPLRSAVITHINRWNLPHLEQMHALLVELGVEVWQVQLAYPYGRLLEIREPYLIDPKQLPELAAQLANFARQDKLRLVVADSIGYYGPHEPLLRRSMDGRRTFWMGCMAGCLGVAVCSNGDVKGCPTHPPEFVVGNVRKERFADIWADRSRFAYNTEWREELLQGECARCTYRRVCRAGCTSTAYAVTGSIYDNPYCLQRGQA